jgi:uncharacterized phage protein (TIGR01671 family)
MKMREILFKAKRIDNGEWIMGGIIERDDKAYIVGISKKLRIDGVEVDPNTICQYTGLTDKNGNKIWENDVVNNLEDEEIVKCVWDSSNCEYILDNAFVQFGLGYCVGAELEVIGNIFDNPELIGGDTYAET